MISFEQPRLRHCQVILAVAAGIAASTAAYGDPSGTTWTGAADTHWTNTGNWNTSAVPTGSTPVTIDTLAPNPAEIGSGETASANALTVGQTTTGTLSINDGGTLTSTATIIGDSVGSKGTVSIIGAGSSWTMTGSDSAGSLWVGGYGDGELKIGNGGKMQVDSWGSISNYQGNGSISVTGKDSLLSFGADLHIGRGAGGPSTGTLTVDASGQVSVAQRITIAEGSNGNGVLNLKGTTAPGVLETGYIRKGAGSATIVFDGGLLRAAGDSTVSPADRANFLQNFSSGDVTIDAGGAFIDTNGYDVGIETALEGSGALTKLGAGRLTLSGANTYTGGTFIKEGSLYVDGSGPLSTGSFSVASQTELRFLGHTGINGAALSVTGNGTTVFQGDSTASGTSFRIQSGGNLWFAENASANDFRINTRNNATIVFAGHASANGGAINLSSSMAQINDSSVANNVAISVTDSALYFSGASNAPGSDISLDGASKVDLSQHDDSGLSIGSIQGDEGSAIHLGGNHIIVGETNQNSAFSGDIQDGGIGGGTGGQLTKAGSGTLVLNGTNTYTGVTTVQNGSLIVGVDAAHATASIAGDVDIKNGATLGGRGSVGNLIINGMIAPGNSIGTLTVNGDYTTGPDSVYVAEVDADGHHDLIDVKGAAHLDGGKVDVQAANGNYSAATDYTLLTAAGGVTGTFDSVTSNLAFLDPILGYGTQTVVLTLIRNDIDFTTVAETQNQRAAADGVQALGAGTPLHASVVSLDAPSARQAFDALSGEFYASRQTALLDDSRYVREAVSDRLDGRCADAPAAETSDMVQHAACTGTVWTHAYGAWGHFNGDANAARLDHDASGFFIGADEQVSPGVHLGFVAGYGHAEANANDRASSGTDRTYQIGLYAGLRHRALNTQVGVAHAWHDLDSDRAIGFPGFSESASADYHARTTQVFAETGYDLTFGRAALTPFVRGAYVHLHTDGFTENGGDAALNADSQTRAIGTSLAGLRLGSVLNTTNDVVVSARGLLGWRHVYGNVTPEATLAFDDGQSFTVAGVPLARDALAIEAGLDAHIGDRWTLGAAYVGQFGGGAESNGVKANFAWHF